MATEDEGELQLAEVVLVPHRLQNADRLDHQSRFFSTFAESRVDRIFAGFLFAARELRKTTKFTLRSIASSDEDAITGVVEDDGDGDRTRRHGWAASLSRSSMRPGEPMMWYPAST